MVLTRKRALSSRNTTLYVGGSSEKNNYVESESEIEEENVKLQRAKKSGNDSNTNTSKGKSTAKKPKTVSNVKVKKLPTKKEPSLSESVSDCLSTKSKSNAKKFESANKTCFASSSAAAGTSVCNDATTLSTYNDSSESDMDWEEVPDATNEQLLEDYNPVIPKEGVEITVATDGIKKKRKCKGFDFALYARRQLNRFKKEILISMHKVHLLCWVAHGIHINKLLNCDNFRSLAFSISNEEFLVNQSNQTISFLLKLSKFYRNTISFVNDANDKEIDFESSLTMCFETKRTSSKKVYCFVFILLARTLNLDVRLCFAAYPISYKDPDLIKPKIAKSTTANEDNDGKEVATKNTKGKKFKQIGQRSTSKVVEKIQNVEPNIEPHTVVSNMSNSKQDVSNFKKSRRRCSVNVTNYKEKEEHSSSGESIKMSTDINLKKPKKKNKLDIKDNYEPSEDSDSDFEIFASTSKSNASVRKPYKATTFGKSRVPKLEINESELKNQELIGKEKKPIKILSSDSDNESSSDNGFHYWSEIYLPAEKKWICVDILSNKIDKPSDIESTLPSPTSYMIAIDNKFYIKDITPKYASDWMTLGQKRRIDPDWWQETIELYSPPPYDKKYLEEEKLIRSILLDKPLPKTVGEFKNHPLYVLKRHLLKFEGIYPEDAPTLGFIRGEPIYARECVHTLHSRETWMKQAKVVKKGQTPYKIVKARPKWDKMSGEFKSDLPLEIFGAWQTEDYIPPAAKDGKVPRNEYGNIELFLPSMLPAGTVHLKLPGLNRISRKLGLDCAPALVGFDGHGGGVHPVFDGFVVCSEFKEVLLAAWDEEQENIRKREQEKREKKVYDNWKKLIRGLLIREKIKLKYGSSTSKE